MMQSVRLARVRAGRLLVGLCALAILIVLASIDGQQVFSQPSSNSAFLPTVPGFGISIFIGVMFLALGMLVWLYARKRHVAWLLFCFSCATMVAFILQTGALSGNLLLTALSNSSAAIAVAMLATLLLFFPRNRYALLRERALQGAEGRHDKYRLVYQLTRAYLIVVYLLGVLVSIQLFIFYLHLSLPPTWSFGVLGAYYLVALSGIITTILLSFRQVADARERQQLRFFVAGVVLAIAPLLLLTVLPSALTVFGLPSRYIVSAQISTVPAVILPAAFGYSILRYQMLVFDRYVRKAVSWILGIVLLAVVGYGVTVVSELLINSQRESIGVTAAALLIFAPLAWWGAGVLADRLFFSDMRRYDHLVKGPDALTRETFDIDQVAELLTLAFVGAFETREVCLFVFDRDSGHYRLAPALTTGAGGDIARLQLAQRLLDTNRQILQSEIHRNTPTARTLMMLDATLPLLSRMAQAKRPLFLSEALKPESEQPTGLARFIASDDVLNDLLLSAVRVQGEMIGLLVMGPRTGGGHYAGPDFDVINLLLTHYAPLLENARLYEQASRHAAMLNALYSANVTLEKAFESIEDVAVIYAQAAATAARAGAEAWLVGEDARTFRRVIRVGDGKGLQCRYTPDDWQPWFYEGDDATAWQGPSPQVPSCLAQTPCYPFAWLPIEEGGQHFGVLALTYARPHLFSVEEKRLWGMFAGKCAAAMHNTLAALALREAYERQKELDLLKDQFIMTASHELRTPLTAVQGYIDLLGSFGDNLDPQERAAFIAKAGRGCDELALMVNNIMDVSHIQEDVGRVELSPITLASVVGSVLEMMEALALRENRRIDVQIAGDLQVMADAQRLKQIILNLLGNAFKYSPIGSPLEISASIEQQQGILRIRDYGSGLLPEEQTLLFERFVRLERHMNSPMRGAGLGLFISRQLVEAMDGNIWVQSSGIEGEGSTFAVALKLYHPAQVLA